jgi:hypothetical protein
LLVGRCKTYTQFAFEIKSSMGGGGAQALLALTLLTKAQADIIFAPAG